MNEAVTIVSCRSAKPRLSSIRCVPECGYTVFQAPQPGASTVVQRMQNLPER